jgi:dolichol-phosphate mannosyltransferase
VAAGVALTALDPTLQPTGPLIVEDVASTELDLSVVLPTYNESANILAAVDALTRVLQQLRDTSYEIIIVDDDSPDRTWELAAAQAREPGYEHVRVMRRMGEKGLATAVIRGWQASRGAAIGVMDADLQHPAQVMASLFQSIRGGATVAVGSRAAQGGGVSDWSFARRLISRVAQIIGIIVLPEVVGRVSDPMSGCFILRRNAIAGMRLNPTGYKILIEVLSVVRAPRIAEVGYVFCERQEGGSKVSTRIYLQYLQHLMRLRIRLLLQSGFVRFSMVGALGVVVDMSVLFLLSDPSTLHWGLTRSKAIAAELAIGSNFLLNDAWTFADRVEGNRGGRAKLLRFIKFNILCGFGLLLNVLILNALFNLLGMNRYLANALAIVAVSVVNYYLNLKFGWRVTSVPPLP